MTTTSNRGFEPPPEMLGDEKEHRRQIARSVRTIIQGKLNATIDVTLNASATTTGITDSRIFATSHLSFMPQSLSATTAAKSLWVSNQLKGSATLNHPSAAATDQTVRVLIIG